MKNIRIEIRIQAIVHAAEGIDEKWPAATVPVHVEEFEMRRVVPLNASFLMGSESGNLYVTTRAAAVSMLAGCASVLPEKLGHAARKFAE